MTNWSPDGSPPAPPGAVLLCGQVNPLLSDVAASCMHDDQESRADESQSLSSVSALVAGEIATTARDRVADAARTELHIVDVPGTYLARDVKKLWPVEPMPCHSSSDSGIFTVAN